MTISATTSRVSYAGNGVTTAFSFPYRFLDEDDLVVVSRNNTTGVETVKTITTHYTVSGVGDSGGGTVTMLTAPATGTTLIIYGNPNPIQDLDLVENDPLPAEEVEERLDRLTLLVQRLIDRMDRAVRKTDGFTPTFDPRLPTDIDTADVCLVVNSSGDGWDVGPTTTDIANAATNATAAAASAAAAAASAAAAALDVLSVTGTSAAPTNVAAGVALTVAATVNHKKYVQGSGGPIDVTANPQIAAGSRDGQWLLLVGCSDVNTLKYEDGTGLSLNGPITLGQNWCLWLSWDNTASLWVEVARREN